MELFIISLSAVGVTTFLMTTMTTMHTSFAHESNKNRYSTLSRHARP